MTKIIFRSIVPKGRLPAPSGAPDEKNFAVPEILRTFAFWKKKDTSSYHLLYLFSTPSLHFLYLITTSFVDRK